MIFNLALKALIALMVGFLFWFLAFLVFMVYAFMPITKLSHSIIFAIAAPTIFMIVVNILLKKLFKEKGWRNLLINITLTGAMTAISLAAIDFVAKAVR